MQIALSTDCAAVDEYLVVPTTVRRQQTVHSNCRWICGLYMVHKTVNDVREKERKTEKKMSWPSPGHGGSTIHYYLLYYPDLSCVHP